MAKKDGPLPKTNPKIPVSGAHPDEVNPNTVYNLPGGKFHSKKGKQERGL